MDLEGDSEAFWRYLQPQNILKGAPEPSSEIIDGTTYAGKLNHYSLSQTLMQ